MESPSKRLKMSDAAFPGNNDFVPLSVSKGASTVVNIHPVQSSGYREHNYGRDRGSNDRPKSRHALPGYEPWVLVKTKLSRQFVHNTETKESLWRIPNDVLPGVLEFRQWEKDAKEKKANAKWAEEQLKEMRPAQEAASVHPKADNTSRRRRSESLQREDEAALMAELAAEAEYDDDESPSVVQSYLKPAVHSSNAIYDSDSSYEEVEVTDSEGEEDNVPDDQIRATVTGEEFLTHPNEYDGQVEFGEDDIAYQLAAMQEDYEEHDLAEFPADDEQAYDEDEDGYELSSNDAANLFREMLDEHNISPFVPWEKLVADASDTSIVNDDRYTVLPNMRARREVWDGWVRDTAARIKEQRAAAEKQNPKIPYLEFLHARATPKLYWPEFKRKYKRESEMNDRKLTDKDREKLYRDHIARLKLPEKTRIADLEILLANAPRGVITKASTPESLPESIIGHLHFISLPTDVRNRVVEAYIRSLPSKPA